MMMGVIYCVFPTLASAPEFSNFQEYDSFSSASFTVYVGYVLTDF